MRVPPDLTTAPLYKYMALSIVSIAFMALLRWNRKHARGIGGKRLFDGNGRDIRWIVSDFVRAYEATEVKMAWVSGCVDGTKSFRFGYVASSTGHARVTVTRQSDWALFTLGLNSNQFCSRGHYSRYWAYSPCADHHKLLLVISWTLKY
jgi:hypothetical protein